MAEALSSEPIYHFVNLGRDIGVLDPNSDDDYSEIKTRGTLYVDYVHHASTQTYYKHNDVTLTLHFPSTANGLKRESKGYKPFKEIVNEAENHLNDNYDLLLLEETARFLAENPYEFHHMGNIRLFYIEKDKNVLFFVPPAGGIPRQYRDLMIVPWKRPIPTAVWIPMNSNSIDQREPGPF